MLRHLYQSLHAQPVPRLRVILDGYQRDLSDSAEGARLDEPTPLPKAD
jgi:hypothetical protein